MEERPAAIQQDIGFASTGFRKMRAGWASKKSLVCVVELQIPNIRMLGIETTRIGLNATETSYRCWMLRWTLN